MNRIKYGAEALKFAVCSRLRDVDQVQEDLYFFVWVGDGGGERATNLDTFRRGE